MLLLFWRRIPGNAGIITSSSSFVGDGLAIGEGAGVITSSSSFVGDGLRAGVGSGIILVTVSFVGAGEQIGLPVSYFFLFGGEGDVEYSSEIVDTQSVLYTSEEDPPSIEYRHIGPVRRLP